jgi:flagellar hook protein FlgE
MFNSFSSALSSLRAHAVAVDTVGNNLANVNTTGFKASDVAFKDIVAESMGATKSETGMGVSHPMTVRNFSQGAIQSSGGALNAAIQGNGFFVVHDSEGAEYLTRDGNFQLDSQGYVTTLTGERVQQWVNDSLSDIQIPNGPSGAMATANIGISANLNATTAEDGTFSTPVEVVDSLGQTHVLTFTFTKTATDGQWDYEVFIPGVDVGQTDPLVSVATSAAPLEFDATGRLTAPASDPGTIDLSITGLDNGAEDLTIAWHFYNSAGQSTLTQFAQASAVSPGTRDGYPSAEIVSVGMSDGGKIVARYGNGQEREVATLALSMIANPTSLVAAGNNSFRVSTDTARPAYGVAETGGRGKVKAGSLEASTVDIAKEFTNLIIYQRGYQANSRVITTADEMSQETLNLKR